MIEVDDSGAVTILRLRHGKVNVMDVELLDELADRLRGFDGADGPVVITGNGRVFSAGVDLRRVLDGGPPYVDRLIGGLHEVFRLLFGLGRPVVAAVDGAAIAGGCVLACACDHRIMADDAGPIGLAELTVGVPFPVAALEVVRHAAGRHADELVYGARLINASEAVNVGLVDETVPADGLLDAAVARAEKFARIPSSTFRLTKQRLRGTALARIDRDSPEVDAEVRRLWSSDEVAAGIAAQLDQMRSGRSGGG